MLPADCGIIRTTKVGGEVIHGACAPALPSPRDLGSAGRVHIHCGVIASALVDDLLSLIRFDLVFFWPVVSR